MADGEQNLASAVPSGETSRLPADWSEDTFPTSANPVFMWAGIMVIGVVVLCLYVAYSSTDRPQPGDAKTDAKRTAINSELSDFSAGESDE